MIPDFLKQNADVVKEINGIWNHGHQYKFLGCWLLFETLYFVAPFALPKATRNATFCTNRIPVCWTPWISLVRALELQSFLHTILPSLISWYVLAYKKHNHARSKNHVNFKGLLGNGSLHQPTQCLSSVWPKSHHQVLHQGGHHHQTKKTLSE